MRALFLDFKGCGVLRGRFSASQTPVDRERIGAAMRFLPRRVGWSCVLSLNDKGRAAQIEIRWWLFASDPFAHALNLQQKRPQIKSSPRLSVKCDALISDFHENAFLQSHTDVRLLLSNLRRHNPSNSATRSLWNICIQLFFKYSLCVFFF